jgi:transcriptional regulator with GAF, ATPase, and Fis domain/HAMP domain-containing protein
MKPRSLKTALLLTVAAVVVASGLIISQIVTHRYRVILIQGAVARAENIAHSLSLAAADPILVNDRVALQKLLADQLTSTPDVAYLFVIRKERVLSHTFEGGVPLELIGANDTLSAEGGHLEKLVSENGERFLDIAWPIFGGNAGVLRLGLSETPYRAEANRLWWQMNLITLAVLLLALLTSLWFIHRLTRPLVQLAAAAEKIDEVSLDTEIEIRGQSEVNKLAASLNRMLARLHGYTQKLKENHGVLAAQHGELDRAHQRVATALSISREVSALPDLGRVATCIIQALGNIVQCRNLTLMVFSGACPEVLLADGKTLVAIAAEEVRPVLDKIAGLLSVAFLRKADFHGVSLPQPMGKFNQMAVFPLQHNGQSAGALLIGCPGECQCVTKDLEVIQLILQQTAGAVQRAAQQELEIRNLKSRVETESGFEELVGKDPKMQVVYKLIEDVARTDATVLIQGESGTGKELVARAIHRTSHRRGKPFMVINCSAYPKTLLESELFGHEKGAFTGAVRRKKGRFEQADGGTVFLDEIGEIPASAQIKLLRVLQNHAFERLGGEETVKVDVRILAATNRDLLQEVKSGRFREDLYYRLNVIPVNLPPLCERGNDIPLLARFFAEKFAREQGKEIDRIGSEAMRKLLDYSWPGNVRELENSIEHAVVLAKHPQIAVADLPSAVVAPAEAESDPSHPTIIDNEAQLIRDVLAQCSWNKTAAASRLGISRSTLYEKLKRFQIQKPRRH